MKKKRYQTVIDDLLVAMRDSDVKRPVVSTLAGIPYITLDKYLRKERSISTPSIAQRLVVITDVLTRLVKEGQLPIPEEVSYNQRSATAMEIISSHLTRDRG